jgi:hypothetical protein
MPRDWKLRGAAIQKIYGLYNDSSVKFIVFPIVCKKKENICATSKDIKKHTILLVYNKSTCQLEYWDDLFGMTQRFFGRWRLIRSELLEAYFIPILKDTLGFEFKSNKILIPKFKETVYGRIKRILEAANFENNYPTVYAAFLTDYIKRNATTGADAISFDKLASSYAELHRWNFAWKEEHRCDDPTKILNTETGNCVKIRSDTGQAMLGVTKESCPYPQLRNVATNACKKIEIGKHYISDTSTNVLDSHVAWGYNQWSSLMQYFMRKFPHAATAPDNTFSWEIKRADRWKLTPPKNFHAIMKKGMTNPACRFIVLFILLTQNNFENYHSNVLIIDKAAMTLERFEPYGEGEWDIFNNDKQLDEAVVETFKPYNLRYLPISDTCPHGFQGIEVKEDSGEFITFGGNCQVWTLWYMDLRLSNPLVPREVLIKSAWKELVKDGSFRTFINGYHHFLKKEV